MAQGQLSYVTGVNEVISNLKLFSKKYEAKFAAGMKVGGLYLQRKSQQIVPIDLGPLKESAFTRAIGHGFATDVIIGYTMAYAIYVHEDLQAKHNAGTEAKYLEKPMRENRLAILEIIRKVSIS